MTSALTWGGGSSWSFGFGAGAVWGLLEHYAQLQLSGDYSSQVFDAYAGELPWDELYGISAGGLGVVLLAQGGQPLLDDVLHNISSGPHLQAPRLGRSRTGGGGPSRSLCAAKSATARAPSTKPSRCATPSGGIWTCPMGRTGSAERERRASW